MDALLLLLLFPLIWPLIAKNIWKMEITWQEMAANIGVVVAFVLITFGIGAYGKVHDTEIINGQVTNKVRDHGSYLRSYSCNCRTSCSGTGNNRSCRTICQTCYEQRYTVSWYLESTIGRISIDHADTTSRSVYNRPDPPLYTRAYVGEPCSKEQAFTNYVKAVPDSLFHSDSRSAIKQYAGKVPAYPQVHSIYQVRRVIDVGSGLTQDQLNQMNLRVGEALRTLGPQKQVNIIVIVTGITDPNYRYAVENAWLGGKKNDITVFIGVKDGKVVWTDAMTFARNKNNELLQVKLRDSVRDIQDFQVDPLVAAIVTNATQHYKRIQMKEFEYLKHEIQPPTWATITIAILSILFSLGLTYFFHREEVLGPSRYSSPSIRSYLNRR